MNLCPVCSAPCITRFTSAPDMEHAGEEFCPECNGAVTGADRMAQVFCRVCHRPVLRACLQPGNVCRACERAQEQEEVQEQRQAAQAAAAAQQVALAQQLPLSAVYASRGPCPQCGSHNVSDRRVGSGNGCRRLSCGCGFCLLAPAIAISALVARDVLWLPIAMAILLALLTSRRAPEVVQRRCAACGLRWLE